MQQAAEQKGQDSSAAARFPLWLKAGFWVCIVIATAAVMRRAIALLASSGSGSAPPQLASVDAWFQTHTPLRWTHVLCALEFVALLPFTFREHAGNSRALERAFFPVGGVTGVTAYAMNVYAIGGWLERSPVLLYNTAFLVSLATAYAFMRSQNQAQHRIWTIRAVAILLGIATTRPVMGVFFAIAPLSQLTPHQFFGIAFWIGFSINVFVIELWLYRSAAERIHA